MTLKKKDTPLCKTWIPYLLDRNLIFLKKKNVKMILS